MQSFTKYPCFYTFFQLIYLTVRLCILEIRFQLKKNTYERLIIVSINTHIEQSTKKTSFKSLPVINVIISPTSFYLDKSINFKKRYDFLFIILLNFIISYFISNRLLQSDALMNNLGDFQLNDSLLRAIKLIVTFGSVIPLLFSVVLTAIVLFIFIKISKVNLTFEKSFYIIFIAQLPLIFSKISLLIPGFANDGVNMMRITGLGFTLKSFIESNFLLTFFNEFDLFIIWSHFLIAIGISKLGDLSLKKAIGISGSLWLLSSIVLSIIKLF